MKNKRTDPPYNSLLYQALSREHQNIISYCMNWLEEYWKMPPLVEYFTDHGKEHCLRLVQISDQFDWIMKDLSESECFSLLMGMLFHDIGMQADVRILPGLRKHMEDSCNVRFTEEEAGEYPSKTLQNEIRKNHHLLTAAMLELMYRGAFQDLLQRGFPDAQLTLSSGANQVEAETMQNIIDICRYHSKLDIRELKDHGKDRVRLTAALLRLFDELDITGKRVSMIFPAFNGVPEEDLRYWNVHSRTQCIVDRERREVAVRFCLSDHDYSRYCVVFLETLGQLKKKNRDVLEIIQAGGYPLNFLIDEKSVYKLNTVNDLPENTIRIILNEFLKTDLAGKMCKTAMKELPVREYKELLRLALRCGSRPLPQNGNRFIREFSGSLLLTERQNGEVCLRAEVLETAYSSVRKTMEHALRQGDLEALADFPLLDVDLSLADRKAQYEKIINPVWSIYQNDEKTFQKILLDLLKRISAEGDRGFAARNLVVLLMAAGYDFEGADLSGLNLDRVDFSWTRPDRQGFEHVSLHNASLRGTTLRRTRFLEKMDQLRSCIFIDQEHFAVGDVLGEVFIWRTAPPEIMHRAAGHQGSVWGLACHERTGRLISCGHDGKIISYSAERGGCFQPFVLAEKDTWLTCLDIRGDLLAAAGGDGNLYFENLQTGESFLCGETGGKTTYHSIRFDFSGDYVLAGDSQGGLLLLKLNAERTGVETVCRHRNIAAEMIRSIEAHGQRSLFYISGGEEIIIAEVNRKAPSLCLTIHYSIPAHEKYIKKLILSSGHMKLFSTANDRWARLWDMEDPVHPQLEREFRLEGMYSSAAAVSPDGRYLLGAVRNSLTMCFWDLQREEELWVIRGCQNWLSSLCFLQDGSSFITGSSAGYVSLWSYDGKDGAAGIRNLYRHPYAVNPVAVSLDDRYLISGSSAASGDIYMWDTAKSRIVQILTENNDRGLRSLVFLDCLRGIYRFVSAGYDNKVRLWRFYPVENRCTSEILSTRFPSFLGSCAVSGDRTHLAFSVLSREVPGFIADGEPLNTESHDICVIDLKHSDRNSTIRLKADRIQTLAFTRDGSMLACGDTLGYLYFIAMDQPGTFLRRKASAEHIGCIAFSSGGDLLACADGSGTVSLWDTVNGNLLSGVRIPGGLQLHTVAFAPGDQTILTAGIDGEVYLFPVHGVQLGDPVARHGIRPYEGLCLKGATGPGSQCLDTLKLLGAKEV